MKIKVNKKKVLGIISIIFIILVILLVFNKEKIEIITKNIFQEEPIKEITYKVFSNENNILKFLIMVTDTENGISQIEYPDGDILTCDYKTSVGLDYQIQQDGEYTFTSTSTTGEKMTETIVINEEFRNNLIEIVKIQEISTEQDYKVIVEEGTYTYYYAIGQNNNNWAILSGEFLINVDMYKVNEYNWQNEDRTTTLKVKRVDEYGDIVQVEKVIKDMEKTENIFIQEEQIIEGESIIACIRDNEIESGNYTLKVNGEQYPAEIYNYDENVNYITNKNLGTEEQDNRMLIMKYNGNLNIVKNNIITAQTRKKGIFIYVAGELTNSGEISMTQRGAEAEGQDVYLWKNEDETYEYVPAVGALGGNETYGYSIYKKDSWHGYITETVNQKSNPGINGTNRQTGGGASGSANASGASYTFKCTAHAYGGKGGNGTSYSGGNCGESASASTIPGYETRRVIGDAGSDIGGDAGGLIIIYAESILNSGKIESNGVKGEYGNGTGGGSINIFYSKVIQEGTIEAIGGAGGGKGGDGSITITNTIQIISSTNEFE